MIVDSSYLRKVLNVNLTIGEIEKIIDELQRTEHNIYELMNYEELIKKLRECLDVTPSKSEFNSQETKPLSGHSSSRKNDGNILQESRRDKTPDTSKSKESKIADEINKDYAKTKNNEGDKGK